MRPGYWLWRLPPDGPMRLYCEWPLVSISLSSTDLDGTQLSAARKRVIQLWPD